MRHTYEDKVIDYPQLHEGQQQPPRLEALLLNRQSAARIIECAERLTDFDG